MSQRVRRTITRSVLIVVLVALGLYVAYKLFEDPGNQVFGPTVISGPSDQRVVALTYDDGPNPPYTDKILDVLAREHVHATFFVVGRAVDQYPQTIKRLVAGGNALGNHTWDHVHLVLLQRASVRAEMRKTDAAIARVTHQHPKIMRPPFGARDWLVLDEMRKLGYTVVMWSVPLPRDWEYPTAGTIARRVIPRVKDGSIIVLHDGNRGQLCPLRNLAPHVCDRSQDIEATRLIIDALKKQGYRFVTIPELLAMHKEVKHKSVHGAE